MPPPAPQPKPKAGAVPAWAWVAAAGVGLAIGLLVLRRPAAAAAEGSPAPTSPAPAGESSQGGALALPFDLLQALGLRPGGGSTAPTSSTPAPPAATGGGQQTLAQQAPTSEQTISAGPGTEAVRSDLEAAGLVAPGDDSPDTVRLIEQARQSAAFYGSPTISAQPLPPAAYTPAQVAVPPPPRISYAGASNAESMRIANAISSAPPASVQSYSAPAAQPAGPPSPPWSKPILEV